MANGIGRSHKPGKQNRQQPYSTTDSSNTPLTTLNRNETINENNDITSKES